MNHWKAIHNQGISNLYDEIVLYAMKRNVFERLSLLLSETFLDMFCVCFKQLKNNKLVRFLD